VKCSVSCISSVSPCRCMFSADEESPNPFMRRSSCARHNEAPPVHQTRDYHTELWRRKKHISLLRLCGNLDLVPVRGHQCQLTHNSSICFDWPTCTSCVQVFSWAIAIVSEYRAALLTEDVNADKFVVRSEGVECLLP